MDTAIDWFGGEDRPAVESERLAALYDLDTPHGDYPAIDWFRGLARMTGWILADNAGMLKTCAGLGFVVEPEPGESRTLRATLDLRAATRPPGA